MSKKSRGSLDYPLKQLQREKLNLDRFVKPSERGKNTDEYIKELREKDRDSLSFFI